MLHVYGKHGGRYDSGKVGGVCVVDAPMDTAGKERNGASVGAVAGKFFIDGYLMQGSLIFMLFPSHPAPFTIFSM